MLGMMNVTKRDQLSGGNLNDKHKTEKPRNSYSYGFDTNGIFPIMILRETEIGELV